MRVLLVLLCAFSVFGAEPLVPARTDWLVFASSDCEECAWLKQECLPELAIRLGHPLPRALLYDFEVTGNYETLVAVEGALGTTGDGVPVLLAGGRLLYGKDTIAAWAASLTAADLAAPLPEAVLPCLTKGAPSLYTEDPSPAPASPAPTEPMSDEATARILYFQTPGCAACALTNTRLEHLAKRFPTVTVQRLVADQPETRFLQYAVAKRLGHLSARDVEIVVNTIFDSLTGAMQRGDRVEIRGFGSFSVRHRRSRLGRNPKTGEAIEVHAKRVPFFTVGHELRQRVDEATKPTPARAEPAGDEVALASAWAPGAKASGA